jgi:hypothetical protein
MVTARVTAQLTARWTARLNVDAAAAWSGLMRVRVSCSRVIREPLKERQAVHTSSSQVHFRRSDALHLRHDVAARCRRFS